MRYIISCVIFLCCCIQIKAQTETVYQQLQKLKEIHKIHFIYDSNLNLNIPYTGGDLSSKSLRVSLRMLFSENGLTYEIHGKNILLKQGKIKQEIKWYSIKGVVTDSVGERLINASIYDHTTKTGVLTDETGCFVLSLPKGLHKIRASYLGSQQKTIDINLDRNTTINFTLETSFTINEVVVTADMNSPVLTTQTGKRVLTTNDIKTEFSLLSSPDLVKTLQRTSGINTGTELSSGLFVHGGNSDENLFLLDGTPIYQTNHSLGLFSSFNADIIKNVDFYKSGFPARYSGRVSSITDVRTKDGNMQKIQGLFSIGLLDGRIQLEGPIVKGKTSFNIAMRRSWIDLLLKPAYAIINSDKTEGDKFTYGYAFHDINAKITHNFNAHKLWLSLYSGRDSYSIKDESAGGIFVNTTNSKFKWGNVNATAGGDFKLSQSLYSTTAIIGAYSYSLLDFDEDDTYHAPDGIIHRNFLDIRYNRTRMYDIGMKTDFKFTALRKHNIRFGGSILHHGFNPQTSKDAFFFEDASGAIDTTHFASSTSTSSNEMSVYAEDEIGITQHLSANAGISYTLFRVQNRNYHLLDPRFAVKWQLGRTTSIKMSYTHMSQSIHRIATSFLEIPSDFWVPTTNDIPPTTSHQLAGGVYNQINKNLTLTVEGFYKRTYNLLQYRHWMGLQPPAVYWNKNVTEGEGKAYGIEIDAAYHGKHFAGTMAYTLSYSKRRFTELYNGWFNDQFDNRHKLDITARYKFTERISAYAAFTLKSGNRMTMPVAYSISPELPGDKRFTEGVYIYGEPNNFKLPAYHRLDIGFDFKHKTKSGNEAIWNVSIYNVYCHLNTMYTQIKQNENGTFTVKSKGFVPVIPSVSYTIKF